MKGEDGLLDEGPDLYVGPAHRLLACGEGLPPPPARDADRAGGAPDNPCRPSTGGRPRRCRGHGPRGRRGRCRGGPQQPAEGIRDDLHVHPVSLVFAGAARPVRGDAVDRQQRALQDQIRLHRSGPQRVGGAGREGGQELDSLGDMAVGPRGCDAEPGRDLGLCVPHPQMGECRQAWRPALRRRQREPIARWCRHTCCVRKRRAEPGTSTRWGFPCSGGTSQR